MRVIVAIQGAMFKEEILFRRLPRLTRRSANLRLPASYGATVASSKQGDGGFGRSWQGPALGENQSFEGRATFCHSPNRAPYVENVGEF